PKVLALDQPADAGCLGGTGSDRLPVLAEEGGGRASLPGRPAFLATPRGASAAAPQLGHGGAVAGGRQALSGARAGNHRLALSGLSGRSDPRRRAGLGAGSSAVDIGALGDRISHA